MRLIDADALEKTICEWIGRQGEGSYYVGYDDALCAVQDLIADAPTITPPLPKPPKGGGIKNENE